MRLFKQSLGVTPHQYILQQRLDRAKYLLRSSDLDIDEIALRVGFCVGVASLQENRSHLNRYFKSITGQTPDRWRQS